MSKRIASLLLSLLMLVTLVPTSVFATGDSADAFDVYVECNPSSVKPGDEIEVKIMAKDPPGIAGFAFDVMYDKTNFQAVQFVTVDEEGEETSSYSKKGILKTEVTVNPTVEGVYSVSYAHEEETSVSTTNHNRRLFSLKLKVKNTAVSGETEIRIVSTSVADIWTNGKLENLNPTYIPATLTITGGAAGHTCGADTLTLVPAKDATCTTDGNTAYYACSCGKWYSDANAATEITDKDSVVIKATNHADAKRTEAKEATCKEEGHNAYWFCSSCNKYFADNSGAIGAETTLEALTINKVDHKWTITKPGAEGSGTHKLVCSVCDEEKDDPHSGDDINTTTWEHNETHHWNKYTCGTIMNKAEHSYGAPTWTWSDNNTATARVMCECGAYQEKTATVTESVTTAATCTEKGLKTYTAKVTLNGTEYTDTKTEDIAPTGHAYGTPTWTWTWNDDNTAAATFTCANDSTHVSIEQATVTESVTTAATCTEKGLKTYTAKVTFGGTDYTDTKTEEIPMVPHNLTETHAKAATCTENGNSAYWTCGTCNKFFSDKDGTTEIEKDSWVEKALGHDFSGAWVTDETGHARKCTKCDEVDTQSPHNYPAHKCDEEVKCECGYIKPKGQHTLKVEFAWDANHNCKATATCVNKDYEETADATVTSVTKEATCTEIGTTTYTAKVTFNGTEYTNTKTEDIAATGHSLTKTDAKSATCTENGNSAYWTCGTCNKFFSDKDGKNEITKDSWVIKALGHKTTKTDAKEPTCTENGNSAYWTCGTCGKFFSDKDGKNEITKDGWVINALGHDLKVTAAVTPTCVAGGNNEYYTCSVCKAVFKADKTTPTTVAAETLAKDPANHTGGTEQRGAVSATCATNGRTADTYCKGCGVRTAVGTATSATGAHTYDANGVCATCGNKKPSVASDDLKKSDDEKTVEGGGWVIKPDDGGKVEGSDLDKIKEELKNGNIKAVIETIISNADDAKDELKNKINSATDATKKALLEKLQGVTGSSTRKLFGVYGVSMKLTGADATAETLGESQNVTIAISEEDYNALKSGTKKMIQAYMDGDTAKSRELNVTLGGNATNGYTVTFAVDKSATYALVADTYTPSGGSYTPSGKTFTTDLPAGSITGVYVNGKKLDSKYYVISGSSVTLTDAYLATLKAGKYTVKIENATHVSTGTFTVAANGALSPKTGDAGMVWYAAMAVSSLLGTAVVTKKRRESK